MAEEIILPKGATLIESKQSQSDIVLPKGAQLIESKSIDTQPLVEKGTPSYKQDFNPVKQAQYIDNGVWDAGDENMSMSRMYNQQKADETVKNLPKMSVVERNTVLNSAKNTLSNYYDTKINIEKQKFSEDFKNDYLENKPVPIDIYAGSGVSKKVDDNITAYQTQLNNQLTKIDVEAYQLNLKDVAVDLGKDFDPSTQDIKTIEQNAFKIGTLQQYPTHENLQEKQQLRADLKNNKVDAYLKQQEQSNNPDAVAMDNDEYSKLVNNGVEAKLDIAKQTQNGYDSRIKLLENVDIVTKNIEKAQQAKEKAEQLFFLNPLNKTPQNLEIYNKSVKYIKDATKDLEQLNQYASQEEKTLPQLKEEKKKWLDYEVNLQRVKQSIGKEYTDWKKISDKKTVEFNTQFDEANKKLLGMGRNEDDLTQVTGKAILDWATGTIAKGLNITGDFIEPPTESQKDLYALKDLGNEELRKKYFGIPEAGYVSKQVLEQTPILDENGNIKDYKFNFNIAALPFQTIKVYAESKALGYGGFLAGEAVEGSLQGLKFAESYLGRSAYSALKGGAQFVGMYPATYILYGQDIFNEEFQKTGNAELAGKIMSARIAIETGSELLHPWEINQFKGADKVAKDMSEKEAYNISMREFGTSKWDKALLYLYGGKEFAKSWAINGKEEYLEEFASNVANWMLDKNLKNGYLLSDAHQDYRQDHEMSIANEYLTAVNTIASMGGMAGSETVRNHQTAINTAQYIVGQNPQAFLDKNKELFDNGKISQEVLDKRNADVNKIKTSYDFASKDINKINQSLKEAKDRLSSLQPTKFEKFFGITDTQKKTIEDELQTHADNQSFLLFTNNKQIQENSAKIPELLKKINLLGDEKSKPQQEELDRLRDEMLNLDLQNEQIAENASQYIDKFADVYGSTVAKANIIAEENPEIPKLEDAIVPKYKDGVVKIPTNKGEKEFKVGEKYIVGRQLLFDSQDPIRFPEITFLGYDSDENGKPKVDDRGVPVVKIRTKNLKGKTIDTTKPIDSFKNYTLGSEKVLNSTDAGRFYNRFKNKKFTLSLTQTKKNKDGDNYEIVNYIGKKLGIKAKDVKQLEGVLSAETNAKGQIETYFNYKHPDTGKAEQILLTDYLIKGNGANSFLKPKEVKVGSVVKKGQFESTTAEELADLELFSPNELAEYNKHVEEEEFANLKLVRDTQNKITKNNINAYIDKISKLLKITESRISKVSAKIEKLKNVSKLLNEVATKENPNVKSLLSVKEKEEYNALESKELKSTYLLDKAKAIENSSYPELIELQESLQDLQEQRDERQADIQEELDFANDLLEQEFPSDLNFIDHLKKEKKALLSVIRQSDKIIEVLKEQIDSFKDALSNLKDTINSVFSYNELTNEIERSSNKSELESKIRANERYIIALETKTEEAQREVVQYNKLIKFLEPFEAERKEKENLRKKKELLELLRQQSDNESSKDKQTSSNRRDKTREAKEDGSWESNRKSLHTLTSSTTSGGYNYQEFLDDSKNNYANRRLVYFTNSNSDFNGYYLLPVTFKSAKTDKYDLSKILYEKELSTDVKMVVVKKTKDGYAFVDMDGNVIDNPTADNVIYTSLPSDKLTDSKDISRFNKKDGVTEEEIKSAQEEFIKFRESIFNAATPPYFSITGLSKGVPVYDETQKNTTDVEFDATLNRKPVIPTLLEGIKEVKTLIDIATVESKDGLGEINDPNNNPVNVPLGRPVLIDKKSKKMQFLDNHYLSKSKQETIVKLIILLARKIEKNIESNNDKIIDTNITGYLGSVLYWRNPEKEVDGKKQNPVTISSNQLWISFDIDGAYLNIGTSTKISLFDVESDIVALQTAVSLMWHNVNKEALSKSIDSKKGYTEISNVDLAKNTFSTTDWDSYEEYLLSENKPDGSVRPLSDIPLTTNVITNVKPFDDKGNPVPNYRTQYESKYFTFQRPYFTTKKQVVVNTNNDTKPNVVSTKLAQKATDIADKQTVKPTEQGLTNIVKAANFIENLEVGKEYEISSTKTGASIIKFKVKSIENGVITTSDVVENEQNQTTNTFIEIMTSSVEGVSVNELPKIAINNYLNAIQTEKNIQEALRILRSNFIYSEIGKEEETENLGESLGWTTNEEDKAKAEKEKTESTPTVSLKDRIKNAKNNNGTNNTNYRLAHTKQYIKEDLDLAKSWFKTRFPNLSFEDVKGLVDGVAFGQFTKNGIILSDAAEIGTVYHEAFEAVAGLLLTKRQWNTLQSEFKRRKGSFIEYTTGKKIEYSKATSEQVKEQLAEEYREYELSGGKSIFNGEVKRNNLFRRIYNLIKSLIFGIFNDIPDSVEKTFVVDKNDLKSLNINYPEEVKFFKDNEKVLLNEIPQWFDLKNNSVALLEISNKLGIDNSYFKEKYEEHRKQYKLFKSYLKAEGLSDETSFYKKEDEHTYFKDKNGEEQSVAKLHREFEKGEFQDKPWIKISVAFRKHSKDFMDRREFNFQSMNTYNEWKNSLVSLQDLIKKELKNSEVSKYEKQLQLDYNNVIVEKIGNGIYKVSANNKKSKSDIKNTTIKEVFSKISKGEYGNVQPSKWERPWNINKAYRIGNIENGIFASQVNKSLTSMMLLNLFDNPNVDIYSLFTDGSVDPKQLYQTIQNQLNTQYNGIVTDSGEEQMLSLDEIRASLDDFDNFFKQVIESDFSTLPEVYQNILSKASDLHEKDADIANYTKAKLKDALTSYVYISDNWNQIVEDNIQYLKRYKIEIDSLLENEQGDVQTQEELKTPTEYTKDPFSIDLKDNTNSKVKLLLATLRKRNIVEENGQPVIVENDFPLTKLEINDIGLPETADFSTTFRTVINTILPATNIEEQLELIKEASIQNPELISLWYRLKGDKTYDQLTEGDLKLRIAFSNSLNKYKADFVRQLTEVVSTDMGEQNDNVRISSTIIHSLQDATVRTIKERWLNNIKELYKENSPYFYEEKNVIKIKVSHPDIAKFANKKDFESNLKLLSLLGFDFEFNISSLSKEQLSELQGKVADLRGVLLSSKDYAKILNGDSFDFNNSLNSLANFEYSVNKRSKEVNHYNVEGEKQFDVIGLSFFTIITKDINAAKTLQHLLEVNPHLKDLYHTNSILYSWLFRESGERSNIELKVEPIEGSVAKESQEGIHTSNLSYADKLLLEFNANLKGKFFIFTPADIKTEFSIDLFNKQSKESEMFVTQAKANNFNFIFDKYLKGYLENELLLAKDIKENPKKRQLKEYNQKLNTKYSGERTKGNSLRFFENILSFDYSQAIDTNIAIDKWIEDNRQQIVKDIENYINSVTDDTIESFEKEGILSKFNNQYEFKGLEIDTEKPYLQDGLVKMDEEQLRNLLNFRSANYVISIFEQFTMFLGDPAQFAAPTKRVKSFVSSRESNTYDTNVTDGSIFDRNASKFYNSATLIDDINTEQVELPSDAPGFQNFNSQFTGTTFEDVKIVESSIEEIKDEHRNRESKELFFTDYENLTEFLKNKLNEKLSPLNDFEKTNEADAQAYMTLPLFRQFLIRSDMWNDDLEKMYQYDLAYERSKVYIYPNTEQGNKLKDLDQKILNAGNPNILRNEQGLEPTIYPVIKPIGAGVRAGDLSITTLDKNSILALSYRLLEERQGVNIYNEMIKTNTHYGRFKSSHKVGEPSTLTNLYDKEGNNTPNILSTDQLLFKHFAIQVETRGIKDKAPRGSQLTKLATINLMSVSVPIDFINERIENRTDKPDSSEVTNEKAYDKYLKEFSKFTKTALREINDEWNTYSEEEKQDISPAYKLVQQHTEVLKNLTEVYTKELFDRVGITETSTGFEISNYTELEKIIKEELKDRNATKDLQNAVKLKDGKFELPFDLLPNGFKIQPLLLSLVDKMVAKPKLFGKSLPQVASTLFEKEKRNLVYKKDGRWIDAEAFSKLSDEEQDSIRDTRKITSNELSFYKKGDKQYIEVLLPAVFKDKLGRLVTDLSQVTPEMLKAIGFRIPTQELSSVENIVIKGFLPLEYGNMIVVPSSITTKAGSDFDIDKLNLYLFNYFYKNGKVEKIQYLTADNSTEQERYKEFIKNKIWDIFDDIKEEDEYKASAKEKLQPIFDKLSEIVDKELKNTEESEQATQAFQEFKGVVNELSNERLSYGITQIIKRNKTVSIYQRQENLENYIKSQTDISNPEDVKKLNQILLAYDYYISLMNEVGKARHLLQFAMRRSVGYNDFKKQIKDVIEDVFSDYVISEDLTIPGTPSFDEFKELPIYQQNSKKALENRYVETLISLLELPENYTRLTTPNSAKALEDMSFKIEELENKARLRKQGVSKEDVNNTPIGTEQQSKDYLNPIQNAFTRYSFQVGKGGVGIGAVGITNHAINQLVNSVATNINTLSILFPSSGIKVEDAFGNISYVNNLSFQRDAEGNWVSNNLSGFINGFVDVANNPFIIKINGNLSTAGAYILSNKLGIGIEQAILMFNQPIVKEFERITALNKGILSLDNLNAKDRATEVFGLRPPITYSRGFFDNKELENMIVEQNNLSEKQKTDQFLILQAYIELKDLSNSLIEAVNTYNWDTDGLPTYPSVFSKIFENKEYAENYDQDAPRVTLNADDLFFKNVKDAYSNFSQATKDLFVSLQNEPFNKATRPLIEPYFKQNMSKKEKEKAVNAIQREVVNYLLLTTPVTIDGKEITIGNLVKALLVNYEKSPAKTLKEIQNKIKKGKLDSNFAVNELFSLFSVSSGRKTNNIRILNKQKDIEYNDLIIESLKEMLNSSNIELVSFAKNLFLLALVQSGVNQSRISISQYIPAEFYNNITSQILAKVNTSQIDYSSFKHLFYANKFNDSTFTKTLTKGQKKNSFGITKGIKGNTVELSKRMVIKGNVITSKKWDNVFQVKFYQVDTNPKTNLPYSEDEIKEFISRNDYSFLKTRVFQRIEDSQGNPIVFQKNPENKNILKYIYREVSLKGDGQFALEYTDKAALHPEIPYTDDATLTEDLGKVGIFPYFIDLEQENFENDKNTINITPTEEIPMEQEVIEQPIQNKEGIKTLQDIENQAIAVIKSTKGDDKYIFLNSQKDLFGDDLVSDNKQGQRLKGKNYKGIDIVSDYFTSKTIKDKSGNDTVDILFVDSKEDAQKQFDNYIKGGAKQFSSIKFVEQPIDKEIKPKISVEDEEKLVNKLGNIKLSINVISNINSKTGSLERKMETFMSDLLQDFRHLESYDLSDLEPLFGKNIADKLLALKPLIRKFVKTDFLAMNSETRTKSAIIEAFNLKKQILSSITDLINPISKNLIKQEFTQEQPIVEETKEGEMTLKDGKNYNRSEIGTKMLEEMGYNPMEIGKLLKEICG